MEKLTDINLKDCKLIEAFVYGRYLCVLWKHNESLIFVYEKDDGTQQHIEYFRNFKDLLAYVLKNKLLSRGENIV